MDICSGLVYSHSLYIDTGVRILKNYIDKGFRFNLRGLITRNGLFYFGLVSLWNKKLNKRNQPVEPLLIIRRLEAFDLLLISSFELHKIPPIHTSKVKKKTQKQHEQLTLHILLLSLDHTKIPKSRGFWLIPDSSDVITVTCKSKSIPVLLSPINATAAM